MAKLKQPHHTSIIIPPEKKPFVAVPPVPKAPADRVNHPSHYTWLKEQCGIEVIDITRHLNFNIGNVIKYVLRSGHKSEAGLTNRQKQIEDLQKAVFYLNDEIKRLQQC